MREKLLERNLEISVDIEVEISYNNSHFVYKAPAESRVRDLLNTDQFTIKARKFVDCYSSFTHSIYATPETLQQLRDKPLLKLKEWNRPKLTIISKELEETKEKNEALQNIINRLIIFLVAINLTDYMKFLKKIIVRDVNETMRKKGSSEYFENYYELKERCKRLKNWDIIHDVVDSYGLSTNEWVSLCNIHEKVNIFKHDRLVSFNEAINLANHNYIDGLLVFNKLIKIFDKNGWTEKINKELAKGELINQYFINSI